MTWDQLFSALLAVGITVLVRLVNKWLPPDQYGLETTIVATSTPPPAPSPTPPAEGFTPPEPPHGPPTAS